MTTAFCLPSRITTLLLVFFVPFLWAAPSTDWRDCQHCHQPEHQDWLTSHHARAMQTATEQTVLGDFSDRIAKHYGQSAHFFTEDGRYWVNLQYRGRKSQRYEILYTFGVDPLQQYLVTTEKGKLQVVPFAWDSRSAEIGGQRWMHLYSDQEIAPDDRLHWQQPMQNWNGMCADCHSGGLVRNYLADQDHFNTQWQEINVGCSSCHGDMATEHGLANAAKADQREQGSWVRTGQQHTAGWVGPPRDNGFMDSCFACHSLRSPLTDGFSADTPYLEQFTPSWLLPPLYHGDGQIREEVYVYGSFLQSKMYAAGVHCLDCHDPHSGRVKDQTNGLCLQCHSADQFNGKQHHGHADNSSGSQCVSCHMPASLYMNVDARRDHSFSIPKPELSIEFGVPLACQQCHKDQSLQWASEQLVRLHGKKRRDRNTDYIRLQSGVKLSLERHLQIARNTALPPVQRASAIYRLLYRQQQPPAGIMAKFMRDKEPLIRLAAAQAAFKMDPGAKAKWLAPLLDDSVKAVRIAATNSLLGVSLPPQRQKAFEQGLNELLEVGSLSAWRGEGRVNQGDIQANLGDFERAEEAYRAAIYIDPYFEVGYLKLAELLQSVGDTETVGDLFDKAVSALPESPRIRYHYALFFIRQRQLLRALDESENALELEPHNDQFAYLYYLLLYKTGNRTQAKEELSDNLHHYPGSHLLENLLRAWAAG
jgi:predicted CXXCH cytochrome family protein